MEQSWYNYANGNTIGTTGSESGKIVLDIEHPDGARITLEANTQTAPFAITVGIYGGIFHTTFCASIEEAHKMVDELKQKIEFALLPEIQEDGEKRYQAYQAITES
jgi:hypothetical protein